MAQRLKAEIVVADSRQVFRGLRIGSGRAGAEALALVPHHMLEVADPRAAYSVADFTGRASALIEEIHARGSRVVVEGGSTLYVSALTQGLTLGEVPAQPKLRAELGRLSREQLQARLRALDEEAEVDLNNPVRVIRAIELLEVAGGPLRRLRQRRPPPWEPVVIGLSASLQELRPRLEARVGEMLTQGLIAETAGLLVRGVGRESQALRGIGYREVAAYLHGELDLARLRPRIVQATGQYARRQLSWWRSHPEVHWLDWRLSASSLVELALAWLDRREPAA